MAPSPEKPDTPVPAYVEIIALDAEIRRTRCPNSDTYRLPTPSSATATGSRSSAALAGPPSPKPGGAAVESCAVPVPTMVEISPVVPFT